MRLRALRGAITVEADDEAAILHGADELIRTLIERNALDHDDIVSCFFTCTPDLTAQFPAVAARNFGLSDVPLMCAQEMAVPGALPRVIRVMLHCYADPGRKADHVYLRDAVQLRRDLAGAQ